MDYSRVLVTGGSGQLGSELKKLMPTASFPSHKEFDVTRYHSMYDYGIKEYDVILHAAAITSPPIVNESTEEAIDTNIIGTCNIVKLCKAFDIKLVYISTDYVYSGEEGNYTEEDPVRPVNSYAWSKLGGECAAMMYNNTIIIRTSFTPKVFPYEKAFSDQYSSRETVDVIASKIVAIIDESAWGGPLNIGGKRQSVLDYARTLDPTVKELLRNDVNFKVPYDVSMDCSLYDYIIKL
jgi:dTDP-4-dehydrorhamnose reductase